ncbi:ABC transporter permease [Ravibacter arvi]|uniref:ABC transporter permease n=1 Tax=Ravibacter arvi TaxID=2051041 RepID=A0ABP8MBB4_9BACT
MIKNFLKITWRNLNKNRMSSFINVGGLALGMTVTILIGLWLKDELDYDKSFDNYERLGQVYGHVTTNGKIYTGRAMPIPMSTELRSRYGRNFKHISMASWMENHILSSGDIHVGRKGFFMEPEAPGMFSLKMLRGSQNGLEKPNDLMLSESAAKALFGDADPITKQVKLDNKDLVTITGVFRDFPENSSFKGVDFLASWQLYVASEPWIQNAQDSWDENSFQVFAEIADNTTFEKVNASIRNAKQDHVSDEQKNQEFRTIVHPMRDWHLRSNWENGVLANGQDQYLWMFGVIGFFVLVLACINFMNLSTARSERRAKEVGIRKTVGSERRAIILQFLCESVFVALVAFLLSVLLVNIALPWFNEVAGKAVTVPWGEPVFWLSGLVLSILTGLLAGSYPALYMSAFDPASVLKGAFKAGRAAAIPRQVLVVLQFAVSVTLIIGTSVVYKQILHTKDRPTGYDRDRLVMIEMRSPDFYGKLDILDNALKKEGAIEYMSESSSPMNGVHSNNGGFGWEGKDPNLTAVFGTIWVTNDYGRSIGWELVAGRDFSKDFGADSAGVIVNEAAVKYMGMEDPVGKVVTWGGNRTYHIVGVVKDVVMSSPFEPVRQVAYFLDQENVNFMNFKLSARMPVSESLAILERTFKTVMPGVPFDYQFADQAYAEKFVLEERVGKLAFFFTFLAIIISCLGLFGLASFTAEQRTKEIGIRKIVGASAFTIWRLLSVDFLVLTLVACTVAIPVSYFLMHRWLQKYTYRATVGWELFGGAVVLALLITVVTVSYQALKAAATNPVKSLRTE